MIPKLSAPLAKDIRTGEGILEWALAAGVSVAGATSNLSVAHTATYVAVVAAVKGARRGLLKVVALTRPALAAPVAPQWGTSTNASSGGAEFTVREVTAPTPILAEPSPVDWEPEHALAPETEVAP